jgi:hypothetical protein
MTEPHPALGPLSELLGTWMGHGQGHYPTIADFEYREEIVFTQVGKPFLAYRQRTWDARSGDPLHTEMGYLRPGGDGRYELIIAQPTGLADVYSGTGHDGVYDLHCDQVARTPTAKPVLAVRRRFEIHGDRLAYDLWMAHAETPMSHHLHAEFEREELP